VGDLCLLVCNKSLHSTIDSILTTYFQHLRSHQRFRCDAFIIRQHNITALALPDVNKKDIGEKARHWSSQSSLTLLGLLKWLWDAVAGPVLYELGFHRISGDLPARLLDSDRFTEQRQPAGLTAVTCR
jgi:hypothetical protein